MTAIRDRNLKDLCALGLLPLGRAPSERPIYDIVTVSAGVTSTPGLARSRVPMRNWPQNRTQNWLGWQSMLIRPLEWAMDAEATQDLLKGPIFGRRGTFL